MVVGRGSWVVGVGKSQTRERDVCGRARSNASG